MTPKQKAAAYVRVSTEEQGEYSPDAQVRAIRDFCDKNGYELVDIYADEGISGRSAVKRPEFQRMIATAKQKYKPYDAILVHKFDRFARSREDSIVYKSLLRRECGVKVISITENIDDDKFSVILEAMLEAMAEYYSLNLAEEVKKGMTEKALRGEVQTIAPFGYKIEDGKLIVFPEQAEIIKALYNGFLQGKTLFGMAHELNNAEIRSNRGNKFENRTIEYILRNPVYVGKMRWTPSGRVRRNFNHPSTIIADGSHEPIIDTDTWEKVQTKMEEQKKKTPWHSKANASGSHWLVGILKCSNCGGGLTKNGVGNLQCNNYTHGTCNLSHSVKITDAENSIRRQMGEQAKAVTPILIDQTGGTARENSLLDKQIAGLQKRLERAKEAYIAGVDSLSEYEVNKGKISLEIEKLQAEKSAQTSESPKATDYAMIKGGILSAADRLYDDNISVEEKKRIARSLFAKIIYNRPEKTLYVVYNHQ